MPRKAVPLRAFMCGAVLATAAITASAHAPVEVRAVRMWAASVDTTRVVLELTGSARRKLGILHDPDRVVLDLAGVRLSSLARTAPVGAGGVRQVRMGQRAAGQLRIVFDLVRPMRAQSVLSPSADRRGFQLVLDIQNPHLGEATAALRPEHLQRGGSDSRVDAAPRVEPTARIGPAPRVELAPRVESISKPALPVKAEHARPQARDLVIAIDAGHGGEDPGAIGKHGTREKDVVLAIARALCARINDEPGMRAVLTRDGDYFVPLRDRMRRARARQADLFVSIHADAIRDRTVDGSSVYILSQRGATDEAARWLAERENAADLIGGVSLDDKSGVLASVLLDLSQSAALSASESAAEHVLRQLTQVGEVRKPQVQQARFMVLKSPDIPSMLIETAYISNPQEEQRLRGAAHQGRLAAAIHQGLRTYFYDDPPAGSRIAEMIAARSPQQETTAHGDNAPPVLATAER